MIAGLLYVLAGAFWWRVRGGAWETLLRLPAGTTKARIATGIALAAPLAWGLGWWAVGLAVALWAGMAMAGWGGVMDIGRNGGRSRLVEAVMMSGWGLVTTGPAASLCAWLGLAWWPLLAAGAAFGPVYALAWWWRDRPHLPQLAIARVAAVPTEWAELGTGAAVALALWAA